MPLLRKYSSRAVPMASISDCGSRACICSNRPTLFEPHVRVQQGDESGEAGIAKAMASGGSGLRAQHIVLTAKFGN